MVDEAGWIVHGDDDSVGTEKRDNIHRTRIGIVLNIPPCKNEPDKKLASEAQKWFAKMKEIDDKFVLVPWKKENQDKGIVRKMEKIPSTMSKFRVYFNRAQARSEGGKVYTDVFVQHTIPINDLKGDAEWFLKENNMNIYSKELQVEETAQKGWFLYSTRSMDPKILSNAIEKEIGVQVALRWKYINSSKYEPEQLERRKWMALHIEVDATKKKAADRGLTRLYSSASTAFPLGIRMRLVSEFREVKGNPTMMGKHMRLRIRQASFNKVIVGYPNDDIMQLDYEVGGKTLREMIMGIKSRDPTTPGNLFHAVGQDWKGRFILNFLKSKENEAAMISDGLIPYLRSEYGIQALQFFDPEAVVEKDKWTWDSSTGTICNPLSKELDGLEAMDEDYDLGEDYLEEVAKVSGTNEAKEPPSADALAASKLNMVLYGDGEDSVSTLGNPLTPEVMSRRVRSTLIAASATNQRTTIGNSSISVMSANTLDTRISVMEEQLGKLEGNLQKGFQSQMDSFFERMQSLQNKPQPPGGELAGGVNE